VPIDVGTFSTEVAAADGEMPLSPAQVEWLVQAVLRRLEEKRREEKLRQEATTIRAQAAPRPGRR
jgi:hypothetical protein